VQQPDILLLDEPTNHLDIVITWLEQEIAAFAGAKGVDYARPQFFQKPPRNLGKLIAGRCWCGA
ncbi:MAG: hypothetical protein IPN27_09905, partial [Cellvibrionales bacterium]|nr:hypothetical protein [Cellvibrionales bacterium]